MLDIPNRGVLLLWLTPSLNLKPVVLSQKVNSAVFPSFKLPPSKRWEAHASEGQNHTPPSFVPVLLFYLCEPQSWILVKPSFPIVTDDSAALYTNEDECYAWIIKGRSSSEYFYIERLMNNSSKATPKRITLFLMYCKEVLLFVSR